MSKLTIPGASQREPIEVRAPRTVDPLDLVNEPTIVHLTR